MRGSRPKGPLCTDRWRGRSPRMVSLISYPSSRALCRSGRLRPAERYQLRACSPATTVLVGGVSGHVALPCRLVWEGCRGGSLSGGVRVVEPNPTPASPPGSPPPSARERALTLPNLLLLLFAVLAA